MRCRPSQQFRSQVLLSEHDDGVVCVTGDAHEGLERAIREAFPGTAWQRHIVHQMRGAAGDAPTRRRKGAVPGIPKAVSAERDPELARGLH
ncbi:transposase [uncultured Collinsella sp.]|uniref:transposase n=1 Tax=uncultured Collinsella sp. TaxID=165190 RepID=UPI0025E494DA|nr:transposase [uncultured Collinsella sp.]